VTVNYATANGTATAPQDYAAVTATTLTFAPGTTTQTITIAVAGDVLTEANETFFVNLTTPVNATITDAQGLGTIVDNDAAPTVSINDVTVTETNAAGVNAVLTVSLSAASSQTVSVTYATANGTATAPADYTAAAATVLSFTPGTTSRTITVPIAGDLLDENNETFVVNLTAPVNATIADAQGVGTIVDNDATPSLIINNVTVTEGNSGSTNATFTVTLSAATSQTVSVTYATANGTATAPADYSAAAATVLSFTPGTTTRTFTVTIAGDLLDEDNETFVVNLTTAVNATIADAQGVGTITDNDATPSLIINNVTVTEGNTGSVNALFTVTLSAASGRSVTVNYATANATATVPADYTAAAATLTFAAGVTSQQITIPVIGDTLDEANETFVVNLSGATNATIADAQGVGTITDNDATPSLAINNVSTTEPDTGTVAMVFTVTLSAASGRTVTVQYATANGTATTANLDYTAIPLTTLTLPVGVTTQTLSVLIRGDAVAEGNETLLVNLSSAVNATIADTQGVGTIVNDD
jgi:ribosomal protein L35AE/L33A